MNAKSPARTTPSDRKARTGLSPSTGTRPEQVVLMAWRHLGLPEPILNARGWPGTPDLLLLHGRDPPVAVFANGCFWHGCPRHFSPLRGENADLWNAKIRRNKLRDAETERRLNAIGARTLVIWEHDTRNLAHAIQLLRVQLSARAPFAYALISTPRNVAPPRAPTDADDRHLPGEDSEIRAKERA